MKKIKLNLKTLFTIGVSFLILVFSLSFYFLLMSAIEDIVKNSLQRRLKITTEITEIALSKYDLSKYESEQDKIKYKDEYDKIINDMRVIRNHIDGIKFIYTAKLVGTNIFYIVDCEEKENERAKIGELYAVRSSIIQNERPWVAAIKLFSLIVKSVIGTIGRFNCKECQLAPSSLE